MVILQLEEQPAIIQGIFAGVINSHIEEQDVNYLDCEKRTPLHAAAFKGDPVITSILLQNGARVNAKDNKWVTPLHRACSVGAAEVVSQLLLRDADANARDRLWQTPLHVAAAAGDDALECVARLLERASSNVDIADRAGRTSLHHAAYHGHVGVVEMLVEKGGTVDACDKKDARPLHYAVLMGHLDVIDLLLKYGADINAKDRNQYTPLHVAAATGCDYVVHSLLSAGAQTDAFNIYGNTPLHIACLNGRLDVCRHLVAAGADVETANFRGQRPLHVAAASVDGAECLAFLLERGVDLNVNSLDGRTPLHMTAIHGRFTRSKTLIDHGALIDCPDKNGCTPLHIAAQYGHDLLANTFLSYGADPFKKGYEGRTPLHMCCLSGYVECARKFVQVGVNLNEPDDTGKTPTHCAAYKGSYECLDLLVSNGADFKSLDRLRRLPIHYAASQGHYQCVFTLVGIGSPIDAVDVEGCAALHLAAAYDVQGKCVEYLLGHRADARIKDRRGFTPLHYGIAGGNVKTVSTLLNHEEKCEQIVQESAEIKRIINQCSVDVTPLHLAAKLGNIDILKMIIRHCNAVNARTNNGVTPLMLAAREGHAQIIHFLLRFGAKVAVTDANDMTAAHYSAKNGHSQGLVLLLHNSEDEEIVNMIDRQHRTALMLAVSGNHIECVRTLLKCGADPNIVDTDEHSCLFRAVVNGQDSIVQLLLSSDAKVQTSDVNGKTVLHLAAACGHLACVQLILEYMNEEEAGAKDNQQCTALHWACYHGYANCVEYLLEKKIFQEIEGNSFSPVHCATFSGSEKCLDLLTRFYGAAVVVGLTDARRRTPLHIAALHGHVDCARRLIEAGASTLVSDDDGRTPLIAAAQYGQAQTVELLLSCKADRTACDKLGNTALHWSCLNKHSHTALLLLEEAQDGDISNIANNDNKTPLHISARNGLVNVTQELLRKGASVSAVDNEGLTPALSCAPNNNVAQCLALILQSLPQFAQSDAAINDPARFPTIPRLLSLPKNQYSQTVVPRRKSPPKKTPIDRVDRHCFIAPGKDFFTESTVTTPAKSEGLGLNLHGSRSETSLMAREEKRKSNGFVAAKPRGCRECYRQQHRCADCSMKNVLKRHLTGRSTRAEFQSFIHKCLTESSHQYRSLLNGSLDTVAEKLGLLEKNITKIENASQAGENKIEVIESKSVCDEAKFLIDKSDPILLALAKNFQSENLEECRGSESDEQKIPESVVVDYDDHVSVRKKKSKTEIACSQMSTMMMKDTISLALTLTVPDISNVNDVKSNYSSDNEFY